LNQFFRQSVPNTGPYDPAVNVSAVAALFAKVGPDPRQHALPAGWLASADEARPVTMTTSKPSASAALVCAVLLAGRTAPDHVRAQRPAQWVVPEGFQVAVFAENVENARSMALGAQGAVFVGSRRAGRVHAVVDRDGDGRADRVVVIASGLDQPNGVAIRNGALYVATASKLLRFDGVERRLDAPPAPVVVPYRPR
jgi:glucose/arabinose dehydrogenase